MGSSSLPSGQKFHVSAASGWQLTAKSTLGRLGVPDDLAAIVDGAGFEGLRPLTADRVLLSQSYPFVSDAGE